MSAGVDGAVVEWRVLQAEAPAKPGKGTKPPPDVIALIQHHKAKVKAFTTKYSHVGKEALEAAGIFSSVRQTKTVQKNKARHARAGGGASGTARAAVADNASVVGSQDLSLRAAAATTQAVNNSPTAAVKRRRIDTLEYKVGALRGCQVPGMPIRTTAVAVAVRACIH